MSYLREHAPFLTLLLAASLFFALSTGCGGGNDDPFDNQELDIPDVGDNDADIDDNDTGETDTDIPDDAVVCDDPIPAPASGERCTVIPGTNDHILFRGTLLAGDEVFHEGSLLVDDQSPNREILCSGCGCSDEPEAQEATVVACPNGVISPGLINPHDHLTYAEGRPQTHGEERFDHRHDWRRGMRNHTQLNTNPRTGSHREGVLLGELRMLFGGATSIAGSVGNVNASGLLRNLDNVNHTEGLSGIDVNYSTFPLGDGSNPRLITDGCGYPGIQSENSVINPDIYLPHISEGIDLEAQNELHCLAGESGKNLIRENTSIIHGIAVNASDVALIADRGAKLVWSARTNIDLYGDTAPVPLYHRFGVPIALGTDWSTSGSMNMLRELHCADYLNRMHYNETFTDREIWQMATSNGALALGAADRLGSLLPGYVADITIFDGTSRLPYRAVIDADVQDITLVLRGGEPLYGDASIIEGLVDSNDVESCEVVDVCERDRRLCLELDANMSLNQLMSGVHSNSYPIFFCGDPVDEPSCVPFRPSEYDGISSAQDRSGDGIPDAIDNCPDYFNPIRPMDNGLQADTNGNGIGDVCDPCPLSEDPNCEAMDPNDWDGDGTPNAEDNCPYHFNPDQIDTSEDGIGDACHPCPAHDISDGGACPGSIYEIKTEVIGDGSRVAIDNVLVTAARPDEGIFVQIHPDDAAFEGLENSGLYVFLRNNPALQDLDFPVPGDRLNISGSVSHFHGQIQLASVTQIELLASGDALPAPVPVEPAEVATNGNRQQTLEAVLVEAKELTVTDNSPAPGGGETATDDFVVDDGLRIGAFFHLIEPYPEVGDTFQSITGVLHWANDSSKIQPRSEQDVITGPPELSSFSPETLYLEVSDQAAAVLTLSLNRPAETPLFVSLSSSDNAIVTAPDTVEFAPGEQFVDVELQALQASDDLVIIEASLDGLVVSASVQTFDADTPRFLESFGHTIQAFTAETTIFLTAELNVPAGAAGESLSFEILPDLDATFDTEFSFAPGERILEIPVDLGSDIGVYLAIATFDGESHQFPFQIFDAAAEYVETFDNFSTPGSSYVAGTFIGDAGFEWEYNHSRSDDGANSIDGMSLIFGSGGTGFLRAEGVEGGIASFSVDMMKAFTGNGVRQLELFINGESYGTSQHFGTSDDDNGVLYTFEVDDIDVDGTFDLELRTVGARQITIDNLTWTSRLPVDPGDLDFPDAELSHFAPDELFLEVSDTASPELTLEMLAPVFEETIVDLSYSDSGALEGPDQVIFAPGQRSATIELRALQAQPDPVTISAQLDDTTVEAYAYIFDQPRQVLSLTSCPVHRAGQSAGFTVEVDAPAGANDPPLLVSVEPHSALASPANNITFAAGETSADFTLDFGDDTGPVSVSVNTGSDLAELTVDVAHLDDPLLEDFALLPSLGQGYSDGEFTGNNSILWTAGNARRTGTDAIDDPSLVFGPDESFLLTENLPGGIDSFSVEMKKQEENNNPRQLQLLVNGDLVASSEVFGESTGNDDTIHTFSVDNLAIPCVESLEIRSASSGQMVIDNISWTSFAP